MEQYEIEIVEVRRTTVYINAFASWEAVDRVRALYDKGHFRNLPLLSSEIRKVRWVPKADTGILVPEGRSG